MEIEGTDGVKHLALGVDVTSSPISIRKKLTIIKNHIANGTLTSMEYFHSKDHNPDFYGTMSNIPQVVIGTDGRTIKELGELWMSAFGLAKLRNESSQPKLTPEAEESRKRSAREARQKLADHRAQFLLLEEVKMQLAIFHKLAVAKIEEYSAAGDEKMKEKLIQVAAKFESSLALIDSILSSKETPSIDDVFKNNEDSVFRSLTEVLNDFDDL